MSYFYDRSSILDYGIKETEKKERDRKNHSIEVVFSPIIKNIQYLLKPLKAVGLTDVRDLAKVIETDMSRYVKISEIGAITTCNIISILINEGYIKKSYETLIEEYWNIYRLSRADAFLLSKNDLLIRKSEIDKIYKGKEQSAESKLTESNDDTASSENIEPVIDYTPKIIDLSAIPHSTRMLIIRTITIKNIDNNSPSLKDLSNLIENDFPKFVHIRNLGYGAAEVIFKELENQSLLRRPIDCYLKTFEFIKSHKNYGACFSWERYGEYVPEKDEYDPEYNKMVYIEELDLSGKSYGAIVMNTKIRRILDLIDALESHLPEIINLPNMGRGTFEDIIKKLTWNGFITTSEYQYLLVEFDYCKKKHTLYNCTGLVYPYNLFRRIVNGSGKLIDLSNRDESDIYNYVNQHNQLSEKEVKAIEIALNQLSQSHKEIILMRYHDHKSVKECAKDLNYKNEDRVRILEEEALSNIREFQIHPDFPNFCEYIISVDKNKRI